MSEGSNKASKKKIFPMLLFGEVFTDFIIVSNMWSSSTIACEFPILESWLLIGELILDCLFSGFVFVIRVLLFRVVSSFLNYDTAQEERGGASLSETDVGLGGRPRFCVYCKFGCLFVWRRICKSRTVLLIRFNWVLNPCVKPSIKFHMKLRRHSTIGIIQNQSHVSIMNW